MNLKDIKGQEHAKRALEVALAGRHSFIMTGPHGVGKTMMLKAIEEIADSNLRMFRSYIQDDIQDLNYKQIVDLAGEVKTGTKLYGATRLCPCGYYGGKELCVCPSNLVAHFQRRLRVLFEYVDIVVELPSLRPNDYNHVEEDTDDMLARAKRAQTFDGRSLKLDESGQSLLRMGLTQLKFNARRMDKTLMIARSIANLDESEVIRAEHVSEALQYSSAIRSLLLI